MPEKILLFHVAPEPVDHPGGDTVVVPVDMGPGLILSHSHFHRSLSLPPGRNVSAPLLVIPFALTRGGDGHHLAELVGPISSQRYRGRTPPRPPFRSNWRGLPRGRRSLCRWVAGAGAR